jgi:hypothetical protein
MQMKSVDRPTSGQAAYANAEHWEHVLGWLDAYIETEIGNKK